MGVIAGNCPKDAVASMNPKLVRQKGPGLPSPVTTLGSSDSIPLGGLSRLRNDQTRGDQHGPEKGWKPERIKSEGRPQCGAGKSWPISHKNLPFHLNAGSVPKLGLASPH